LVYFAAIGNILWPFDIFCGHLVFGRFGMLYKEKSGSPVRVCVCVGWIKKSNLLRRKWFNLDRHSTDINHYVVKINLRMKNFFKSLDTNNDLQTWGSFQRWLKPSKF
jgi:hypothetical protein